MAFEEEIYDRDITIVRTLLKKIKRGFKEMVKPFPEDSLEEVGFEAELIGEGKEVHTFIITDTPLHTCFAFDKHGEFIGMQP